MSKPHTGPGAVSADHDYLAAVDAYERGDAGLALRLAQNILRHNPQHLGALYMSGSISLAAGRPLEALPPLETAARLHPQRGEILQILGSTYFQLGHWEQAVAAYEAAYRCGRKDASLLNNLGLALKEAGDAAGAVRAYREALQLNPEDPDIYNNLGTALNRIHDHPGAIDAYRHALELRPENADIWANLATIYEHANMQEETEDAVSQGLAAAPQHENLHLIAARCSRRRGDAASAIARLEYRLASAPPVSPGVRRVMQYELGRCYDRVGDYKQAFGYFSSANQMTAEIWPDLRKGADAFLADLESRLAQTTADTFKGWPDSPNEERLSPIFLVGFPRSGTTLMDTILGSHPRIVILEEEPPLEQLINKHLRSLPAGYPASLTDLTPMLIRTLRAEYWHAVDEIIGETPPGTLVVDKNPFYSAHAGLIHLLFPGARFIFALRHPCDVVLSCFMQAFGRNPALENFRSLSTAAITYSRVMDLWLRYREALPLSTHELRYEALIERKDQEIRSLLAFLALDWDDAMLDHTVHAKKRGRIYTPSYHQVVQPLYTDAIGRWHDYAEHFGRALEILRPYIEKFGYSVQKD
ncbi:MAG: tetratricopeptide repeat-containing sulfotransferase family protein [Bacillota bacterium]